MLIAPPYAQTFPHLQFMPGWTPKTGAGIGGVAPEAYGMNVGLPDFPTAAYFWAQADGANYEDVLWGPPPVPLPAGVTHAELSWDEILDSNAGADIEGNETDLLLVIAGEKFNGSTQNNYAGGGEFQTTGWVNVAHAGIPAPNMAHHIVQQYQWGAPGIQVAGYSVDGTEIPITAPVVPAIVSNWQPGFYVQKQLSMRKSAGKCGVIVDNMTLRVW